MAFVKAGAVIPPRSVAAGIPAKVLRELSDEEIAWKSEGTRIYQELAQRYLATMREVEPLRSVETGRPSLPFRDHKPKHEQG